MTESRAPALAALEAFRTRVFGVRDAHAARMPKASATSDVPTSSVAPNPAADAPVDPAVDPVPTSSDDFAQIRQLWGARWDRAPEQWKNYLLHRPKVFGLTQEEECRIQRKNASYVATPELTARASLGTSAIVAFVSSFGRFILSQLNTLHTFNLPSLHTAIERRDALRGLLTFSNHRSVMDDPFLVGALMPPRILLNANRMRWGMCSLDICFQDALVSRTLRLGKALPIQRRGGVSQPFLSVAGEKLRAGDWVHIFPEGRVHQEGMGYYKRGAGKVLAMAFETNNALPIVIPMYHEGIEHVMPHNTQSHELESKVPCTGKELFVVVGEPIDVSPIFDRLMPECEAAGGTATDPPPCVRLYDEVADFMGITMRLLRAEARRKVRHDLGVNLGEPYEFS